MRAISAERKQAIVLGILCLIALSYRLWFGAELVFPIDNDAAYYRGMGALLGDNFGQQNLVWHYLTDSPNLERPSFDYWMPLPALLSGLSSLLFGGGPGAETLPGIIASVALTALVFLLGLRLGLSLVAATAIGLLSIFLWATTYASLDGDSPIFYAAFVNLAFFALTYLEERPLASAVIAGASVALAHLSRSDAILLIPALALWGWAEHRRGYLAVPRRAIWLGLGTYLAFMAPFLLRNLAAFGAPLPPGSSKAVWAISYYAIYALLEPPTIGAYFDQGIGWLVATWQRGLSGNVGLIAGVLPAILWPFAAAGLGLLWRRRVGRFMLLFAGLLFLFHGTALAVVGGFKRSYVALIPLVLVLAGGGFEYGRTLVQNWLHGKAIAALALLVMLTPGVWFAVERGPQYRANYAEQTTYDLARHAALGEWFENHAPDAVIASPKPFFPWYATQLDCVMIPHRGGSDLAQVVERLGVTHLVIDLRRTSERPDLQTLHAQAAKGEAINGFVPAKQIADLAIYVRP